MTKLKRLARLGPLRVALAAAMLCAGPGALAARTDTAVAGEVLLKLGSTASLPALLARYDLELLSAFGKRPIYRLRIGAGRTVSDVIASLRLEPDVLIAEPNLIHGAPESRKNVVWAIGSPQDYAQQWAPVALRLDEAHRISIGTGVRVAVLDTGVDRTHPLLADRLIRGYDFVDADDDPSEGGSDTDAGFGHGTHVAGLVATVAPGASIMPVRVLDAAGQGNTWVLAEALMYAVDPDGDPSTDDGAHVINLSLGTTARTRILDSMAKLATCTLAADDSAFDISDPGYDDDVTRCANGRGVVIAAAAGNDGSDSVREYPAAENVHGLMAVTATDANARLARFANYGSWVRIAAPGEAITSSVPGGRFETWSGTSMATPLVAGTAALLLSADPTRTPDDVVKRIEQRSALLCGTNLREVDAAAALEDRSAPPTICP